MDTKLTAPTSVLDAPPSRVETDQGKMSASCVFAVDTLDRVGDVLNIAGVQTGNHQRNPIVLFNHKSESIDDAVGLTQDPAGNYTVILRDHDAFQTTYFCQNNLLAEQLYDRIVAGQIKANSIGYRSLKKRKNNQGGFFLDEVELVEVSWVLIGANADALRSCLSRDRICGKSMHPALKAAYQAHVPAKTTVSVTGGFGGLIVKAIKVKNNLAKAAIAAVSKKELPPTEEVKEVPAAEAPAAEAAKAETPPPAEDTPAPEAEAAPAIPHGAEMLQAAHEHLKSFISYCDENIGKLENEDVTENLLGICEETLETLTTIQDLYANQYPDLPALEGVSDEADVDTEVEEVAEETTQEGKEQSAVDATAGGSLVGTDKQDGAEGKNYSSETKRLTKAMGNTIKECADHLTEMKDADNLNAAQKLVCRHYSKELSAMTESKEAEAEETGEVVDDLEKEYDALSPADQKAFEAELAVMVSKQEAADRRAALVG